VVRSSSGRVGRAGECPRDLFRGEGGVVFVSRQCQERRRRGSRWEKMGQKSIRYLGGVACLREVREALGGAAECKSFGYPDRVEGG